MKLFSKNINVRKNNYSFQINFSDFILEIFFTSCTKKVKFLQLTVWIGP